VILINKVDIRKIKIEKIINMKFNNLKIINKTTVKINVGDSEYDNLEVVATTNEDFNFYMNGIKKEYDEKIKTEILEYIKKNINYKELEYIIAVEDYNKIYSKLSFEDICRGYHNNKEIIIKQILENMNFFIKIEEYEKCIILKNLLEKARNL